MKLKSIILTAAFSLAGLIYQGCETVPTEQEQAPTPEIPEREEVSKAVGTIKSDIANVTKTVDKFATVGETFTYNYEVTPNTKIKDVVLTDKIPDGLTYVTSSPRGNLNEDEISWDWEELDEGTTRQVSLTLQAEEVGTYRNCATITGIPVACTLVTVGKAELQVIKNVDRTELKVGETANYRITVRNTGNATAKNVVLSDRVPSGLVDVENRSVVTFDVGDLEAGDSESFDLPLRTTSSGEFVNVVTAEADNVPDSEDLRSEATINVRVPGIEIEKTGTTEQFAGKQAQYEITVRNAGETTLRNVQVVDTLPVEYRLINAGGGSYNETEKTITWNISTLPAQGERIFTVTVVNLEGGTFNNTVSATVEEDDLSDTANQRTTWEGYPGLLLETIDSVDPILVGDTTTYVIRVTNQGTANDYNVRVRAMLPEQLEVTTVEGDTQGTVDGKNVAFAPIGTLRPKQTVEFRINVVGAEIGDGRTQFLLNSSLLEEAVTSTESTQVY